MGPGTGQLRHDTLWLKEKTFGPKNFHANPSRHLFRNFFQTTSIFVLPLILPPPSSSPPPHPGWTWIFHPKKRPGLLWPQGHGAARHELDQRSRGRRLPGDDAKMGGENPEFLVTLPKFNIAPEKLPSQ